MAQSSAYLQAQAIARSMLGLKESLEGDKPFVSDLRKMIVAISQAEATALVAMELEGIRDDLLTICETLPSAGKGF